MNTRQQSRISAVTVGRGLTLGLALGGVFVVLGCAATPSAPTAALGGQRGGTLVLAESPPDRPIATSAPCNEPTRHLDRSQWPANAGLTILEATTRRYRARWVYRKKPYDYQLDCAGWIGDDFIHGHARAYIRWNLVTSEVIASPINGHRFDADIARTAASWAAQTIYPGIDLNRLRIERASLQTVAPVTPH